MKKTGYRLQIENPCLQDWDAMRTTDGGRFCNHCSHRVIDFTQLTDNEVLAIIEKSNGQLCGRFDPGQLNRLMIHSGFRSANPGLYKILAGLLLLASANIGQSQSTKNLTQIVTPSEVPDTSQVNRALEQDNIPAPGNFSSETTVSGYVMDMATQKPIPNAHVIMKNSSVNLPVDAEGKFTIVFPHGVKPDTLVFVILAAGYKSLEFVVDRNKLPYNNDFFLEKQQRVIMGRFSKP